MIIRISLVRANQREIKQEVFQFAFFYFWDTKLEDETKFLSALPLIAGTLCSFPYI
jgi:hypothetical protein